MNKKGIILLISLLMLSIVFSISLSIFSIIFSGIKISGTVRESQLAFYAADSGVECALYVDKINNAFGGPGSPNSDLGDCEGYANGSVKKLEGDWTNGAIFTIKFGAGNIDDPCVEMTVDKRVGTIIKAIGKNTCDPADERTVNRSLGISY